jgi:hypothetical protein
MINVVSTNLAKVGYEEPKTLVVVFKNGDEYHYFDVPKFLHDELLKAESIGSFFVKNVKQAGFKFKKIEKFQG